MPMPELPRHSAAGRHLPLALDARDKRILVTAGGDGIGRSIAEIFVAAGAQVHVTDIRESALNAAMAEIPGVTGTVGNAADPEHAHRVLADVTARFGGLDILVNNVGVAGPTGEIETYVDADVSEAIDINLKSNFYFLNRFVPLLKKSDRGPSVLAISSVAGRLGHGLRTPYVATKWAIVGLIQSMAIELGPHGIRANAILPGFVNGPRMEKVIADRARALGIGIDEMRESYLRKISLRRMVDAEDIARLALFLASDLARNISGQAIGIDGNVEYL